MAGSTQIHGVDANRVPREVLTDTSGRLVLAPSTSWAGSTVTLSTTGVAIGAGTYPGGILVTNTEASGGISMYLAPTLAELAAAGTRYLLAAGLSVVIPTTDPAGIFAKSASGAPLLSWIGA